MTERLPKSVRYSVSAAIVLAALIAVLGPIGTDLLSSDHLPTGSAEADGANSLQPIPARRGAITDRFGVPLALSRPTETLWVNPSLLRQQGFPFDAVGAALGISMARLERLVSVGTARQFVYLRRRVDPYVADAVMGIGSGAINRLLEYRRFYPHGSVVSPVVGYTSVDGRGLDGMELAVDPWLSGRDGLRHGVATGGHSDFRVPRDGRGLRLSIDLRLQYVGARALLRAVRQHGARAGALVLLEVESGEVLVAASVPAFNPDGAAATVDASNRNRVVSDTYEPGAILWPFVLAAALESGAIEASTPIDTNPGLLRIGPLTVRDPGNFGVISAGDVLAMSSNVGIARIGLELEPSVLRATLSRLGFGRTTHSGLPGESEGLLADLQDGGDLQRAGLARGYGMTATPLQIARAYLALADDGMVKDLSFQPRGSAAPRHRAIGHDVARTVRRLLGRVGAQGLGTLARHEMTGRPATAQKAGAGGYAADRYVALFAGFAPADAPRFVAVAVIDEPSELEGPARQVAMPVAQEMLLEALRAPARTGGTNSS